MPVRRRHDHGDRRRGRGCRREGRGTEAERRHLGQRNVTLLPHLHVDHDHGDVVGAAVLVGRLDQPLRRLPRVVDLAQDVCDLVGPDLIGQAVRAEEHAVAGAQRELPHVGLDLGGNAEGAGEDMALGVDGCLLLCHFAVAHPLLGQAVVVSDLRQLAPGEDVGPGVADVGQGQHVLAPGTAHQRHGGERCPHAAEVRVGLALLPDRGVGLHEGLAQPLDARCPLERLVERLHGDPRRHLTADVTTHAVRDRVEVGALERQVLVHRADPADVGGRARPQNGQRETSKTVEPIWSRSPLPNRAACLICSELTNVPLVEPRSSTQS